MLYKLITNGINGNIYNAIKQMYLDTEASVKINGMFTDWFNTNCGVKQGDGLSSTLFNLYINDLAKEIKSMNLGVQVDNDNVPILLYADDLVLISNTEEGINSMLETLNKYCCKWRISVNFDKSEVVHFRKPNRVRSDTEILLGNKTLKYVNMYKYLGIIFHENLNFEINAEKLANAASRSFGSIVNKFNTIRNMSVITYSKLFTSNVLPILEYGSGVWGFKEYNKCDQVIFNAIRFYLGVHKFTPITGLLGELGWLTSKYNNWINMLRLWNRIININNDRLIRRIFNFEYKMNKINWCNQIKIIMDKLDLTSCFTHQTTCNIDDAKIRINKMYCIEWQAKLNTTAKLRTYRIFKGKFEMEKYVTHNLTRCERSYLAQFRLGILGIRIETGRFVNEMVEDRKCQICNNNNIEDEIHFLLYCTEYDTIRQNILGKIINSIDNFNTMSNEEKLKNIMCENQQSIARYIVKAIEMRKDKVNE